MRVPEFVLAVAVAAATLSAWAMGELSASAQASSERHSQTRAGVQRLAAAPLEKRNVVSFWTPRRMRRAARNGTPAATLHAARVGMGRPPHVRRGSPVLVPSSPPRRSHRAGASHFAPVDPAELEAHGRLFFRFQRFLGSCSATVINTPRRNVVVTAGHCLYDPLSGTVSRRVVFVPAYEDGDRPFGSFEARSTTVMTPWARRANTNFDVGVVVLGANQRGRVGDVVGASGWATGLSRGRDFEIYGYPAGALLGRFLRECDSRTYRGDGTSRRIPGPPTMRAFCDMARGASGGGWVTEDGEERYVNGVTSYRLPKKAGVIFSPYFGRAVSRLIRSTR